MTKLCRPFTKDPSILDVLGCSDAARLPVLPGALLERSDAKAWLMTVRVLGFLVLLAAAAPLALDLLGWPGPVILAVFLGMQFHKLTILLHECVHGSFFRSRGLNRRVGIVAAALAGTSFRGFQRAHMLHHRHNGLPDDAEGSVYPALHAARRGRLLVQIFGPLVPVAAWKTVMAQVGGRGVPAGRETAGGPDNWTTGGRALLALLLAQVAMATVTSWGGLEPWLAPFYQVTAVTFGLFFSRLRGFCEHIPPHGWPASSFTRTHRTHWLEGMLLYDLGMNWHIEHHLYPTVPCYHLPEVHRQLSTLHTAESCSASMVGTVLRRLRTAPSW